MTRARRVTQRVLVSVVFLSTLAVGAAPSAWAGPVILGGDDLTDHGFESGGVNFEGWLYIQKALQNLAPSVTRPGASGVAALGTESGVGDAGQGIDSAAAVAGLSVTHYEGGSAIDDFFVDLAGGTTNPAIMWLAGTDASGDLDSTEGAALTGNAAAINSFVASGGGLMSHGSGPDAYGWLSALLPGLVNDDSACNSVSATLTPAGIAAFPGLSNSDVDSNAGPCHSHFTGNFGGLTTLALDGDGLSYIIGGGGSTLIQCGQPGQPACPTHDQVIPEPSSVLLFGLGGLGAGLIRRRRTKHLAA